MIDIFGDNESLTLDDYLLRVDDPDQRETIEKIVTNSIKVLGWLNNSMGKNKDLPEIRIITNTVPNAEAISYVIRINSGLIDHCLLSTYADYENIFGRSPPDSFNSYKIASVTLSWIFAHEWAHILRCHDDVIKEIGDDPSILQALEHDADYCAIAATYRQLQAEHSHELSDIAIRELLFYCLFWTVRTLPSLSNTHEEIGQRLCNFMTKIASLSENPFGMPDNSFQNTETHIIAKALADLFIKCEKSFQAINTNELHNYNLFQRTVDRFNDNSYMNTTFGWIKISPVVERLSQTRAAIKLAIHTGI